MRPLRASTLAANGGYSFDPANAAYHNPKAGQTLAVAAPYTLSDGKGGTATATLTVTVTGTNDAPVATAASAAATEDGAAVTAALTATDVVTAFPSGSDTDTRAQVFAADGAKIGTEILVNTATSGDQFGQRIVALSGGGFVATWSDVSLGAGGATSDTSSSAAKAQVFAADGSKLGVEFLVNTATRGSQAPTGFVTLPGGGFTIVWDDGSTGSGGAAGDTGGNAIKAQVFSAPQQPFAASGQVPLDLRGKVAITDVDVGAGAVTATLAVGYGVITATAGTSGASVAGSGTASVTVTGTLAQVQALLGTNSTSTLTYAASAGAPPASTTLNVTVNDGGNTGSGGAQNIVGTQTISIAGDDASLEALFGGAGGGGDMDGFIADRSYVSVDFGSLVMPLTMTLPPIDPYPM